MSEFITANIDDSSARAMLSRLGSSVRAMLSRLGSLGGDLSKPMKLLALSMEQQIRQTFREERDPWGVPWPPLSPLTINNRKRRGNASIQKLIDTEAMYDSIERSSDATSAAVSAGTGLPDPRATVNQFGTDRIEARPFFPLRIGQVPDLTDKWLALIVAPIAYALDEAIHE